MKSDDSNDVSIESVKKMIADRDQLDLKIGEQEAILKSNNADMSSSLVDEEGFPLASIDVYAVRHARNSIICWQNDRKKLTEEIEKAMLALHEQKRKNGDKHILSRNPENDESVVVHRTSNKPFAKVDKVMNASPAQTAGLRDGDQIIQFGSLHAGNFLDMKQFRTVVQNSISKKIRVTVLRDGKANRLELVPREWSGKGALGCSVLPVSSAHLI